jgi:hypothetical protein
MAALIAISRPHATWADEPVEPSADDCPRQMQAYWRLDESSGPIYEDSVGAYDATCEGRPCPTSAVEDPQAPSINGAQHFSTAAGTRLNVPANAAFDWSATSSFTIEFWMRVPADALPVLNQVVIGREAPSAESQLHWWVGSTIGGQANFTLWDTDGVSHYTTADPSTGTNLHDGTWHHVAAVRDGALGRIRIYVDGLQEGDAQANDYTGNFAGTRPLNVGWLNYSLSLHYTYDGDLDELAIYRRALAPAEILDHAQNRRSYCGSADLSLAKAASSMHVWPGETVRYTYNVRNSGGETLTNVVVVDDKCSPVTGPQNTTFAPGQSAIYACSQVLNQTTTNTGTVTARDAQGGTISVQDTITVRAEIHSLYLPSVLNRSR